MAPKTKVSAIKATANKPEIFTLPKMPTHPMDKHPGGLVHIMEQGNIAKDFITSDPEWDNAVRKAKFVDRNELNDIIKLHEYYMRFNKTHKMDNRIKALLNLVNGTWAIGGYSVMHAVMVATGIVSPEASGVSLDKEARESLRQANKDRQKQREMQDQHPA
jgi:hypothetical protein